MQKVYMRIRRYRRVYFRWTFLAIEFRETGLFFASRNTLFGKMDLSTKQDFTENGKPFEDIKEDFGDLTGTMFGYGLNGSASPLEDDLLADPENCGICGWVNLLSGLFAVVYQMAFREKLATPRVLSCLHVFCEHCLDKKLMSDAGDAGTLETTINCPTCDQNTVVSFHCSFSMHTLDWI